MNTSPRASWCRALRQLVVLSVATAGVVGCRQAEQPPPAEPIEAAVAEAPLVAYVKKPDPAYAWELTSSQEEEGYTLHVLRMTSQSWLTEAEVDRPVWQHWLTILEPHEVTSNRAFLYITGGDNDDEAPSEAPPLLLPLLESGTYVAELRQVPNQPLVFANDDFGPRVEDEMIAYAWRQFLEGGAKDEDIRWLPRLPMTKAAVRALDTITAFAASEDGDGSTVNEFVVAGASKRGWTTWTTAIADDRVIAIAPIVIDLLNVQPSFEHHWRVYGFWAPAVGDYERENIMSWQKTAEYRRLNKLVEPYEFRQQLELPKLLLNATGDQFFLPDSWQFYWSSLEGEKHLRYVPNAEHSMRGTDVAETLYAFYEGIVTDTPRPEFDWSVEGATLRATPRPGSEPSAVTLWQAVNEQARDFRVDTIGRSWQASEVSALDGSYEATLETPAKGWRAGFLELTFPGPGDHRYKLTSGVVVTPPDLPFEPPDLEPPASSTPRTK